MFVENVLMQTTIVEVIERTVTKLLKGAGARVAREIVLLENLRQVTQIVLAYISFVIVNHIGHRGGGSAVIKCRHVVRQDQNESAARA